MKSSFFGGFLVAYPLASQAAIQAIRLRPKGVPGPTLAT